MSTIDNETGRVLELSPDLEAIRARAAAADGSAQPSAETANEEQGSAGASSAEPEIPFAKRLAGDMLAIGNMLAMRFPSLKVIYTPENCTRSAEDMAPALEKLGWTYPADVGGLIYAKAIAAGGMMLLATREAIIFDIAKEKQAAAASSSAASPGAEEADPSKAAMPQMDLYQ
jgi:hypothetical protein